MTIYCKQPSLETKPNVRRDKVKKNMVRELIAVVSFYVHLQKLSLQKLLQVFQTPKSNYFLVAQFFLL